MLSLLLCWHEIMACHNIDFSQLMSQFDYYQIQLFYLTMEHYLAENLQHETSPISFNTWDQFEHISVHGTNHFFFFWHSFVLLPFLNNKTSYAKVLLFSFIFTIKMATEKFTNFDTSFKCMLI